MVGAIAAVSSELDGFFILKNNIKTAQKAFLVNNIVFAVLQTVFGMSSI